MCVSKALYYSVIYKYNTHTSFNTTSVMILLSPLINIQCKKNINKIICIRINIYLMYSCTEHSLERVLKDLSNPYKYTSFTIKRKVWIWWLNNNNHHFVLFFYKIFFFCFYITHSQNLMNNKNLPHLMQKASPLFQRLFHICILSIYYAC